MRLRYKRLYLLGIVLLATAALAQNPIVDKSIATDSVASRSILKNHLQNKYKLVLSYSVGCAMGDAQIYYAFGFRNERWEKIELSVRFKSRNRVYDQVKRIKSKKQKLKDSSQIDSLLQFWDQNEIWKLNTDSVNVKSKKVEGVHPGEMSEDLILISDGCVYSLEIFDSASYCIISSYEPERYQEQIPVPQRERFILLKDQLMHYWNTVR